MTQVVKQYEPKQTIANQSLLEHDNENIQSETLKSYELAESLKNKRLAKNFANLLQIGEPDSMKTAQKTVININFFLEHRSEILAMKEQVQMIRSFIHA